MKKNFTTKLLVLVSMIFLIGLESYGQHTYTSNGTCNSSDPDYFSKSSCWTRVVDNSCSPAPSQAPALNYKNASSSCEAQIIINHPINISSLNITGDQVRIIVKSSGSLNLSGNLSIDKGARLRLIHDGGSINIGGIIEIGTGTGNDVATLFINGTSGISGEVITNGIDFQNQSNLSIGALGVLINNGEMNFAANNITVRNEGFIRTESVRLDGKAVIENVGDGLLAIDGDLTLTGNAQLQVKGNAEVLVGGDIIIPNNSGNCKDCPPLLDVIEGGAVRLCDPESTYPEDNDDDIKVDDPTAFYGYDSQNPSCRILPISLLEFTTSFLEVKRNVTLNFSTAKEWETSHFEIERAINSITDFKVIGKVYAAGWKETITNYEFVDETLPLAGKSAFYRIKIVDLDNSISYSKVQAISLPPVSFTKGVWRAYPNPSIGNELKLGLLDPKQYNDESISVRMIHPLSITETFTAQNIDQINSKITYWVNQIPTGVFVLEIVWGDKIDHIKVLKK